MKWRVTFSGGSRGGSCVVEADGPKDAEGLAAMQLFNGAGGDFGTSTVEPADNHTLVVYAAAVPTGGGGGGGPNTNPAQIIGSGGSGERSSSAALDPTLRDACVTVIREAIAHYVHHHGDAPPRHWLDALRRLGANPGDAVRDLRNDIGAREL